MNDRERTFIVGNGPLYDGDEIFYECGAVRVEGDRIAALGSLEELQKPGIPYIDVKGNLIVPGLINMHHHFYSALATGLRAAGPIVDFKSNLENFWWVLDRALDEDCVELSAWLSLADSLKHGVTTVFDHHSSPTCQEEILDRIAACVKESGSNAVLCLEVSDRNGLRTGEEAIEENLRFMKQQENDRRIRGVMGLHANLTLSRDTLSRVRERLPEGGGILMDCGEADCDVASCGCDGSCGPVVRLDSFGLLGPKAILAHGVHLTPEEHETIRERESYVVHNPESNCKNAVGELPSFVTGFGLGTDGMTSNMLATLRFAFLRRRCMQWDPGFCRSELLNALFTTNARAASTFLDDSVGVLKPGARADIAVFDYRPVTPIDRDNAAWHLIFGAHAASALYVFCSGSVAVWNGKIMTFREEEIREKARAAAQELFGRIGKGEAL